MQHNIRKSRENGFFNGNAFAIALRQMWLLQVLHSKDYHSSFLFN
ncbi:MAG: hypothetical protein V7K48_15610 [Nostoc sp.]